jgi:polysaccharide biosynthesis transport protein
MMPPLPHDPGSGDHRRENELRFVVGVLLRFWKSVLLMTLVGAFALGGTSWYLNDPGQPAGYEGQQTLAVRQSAWDAESANPSGGAALLLMEAPEILRRISPASIRDTALKIAAESQPPQAVDAETWDAALALSPGELPHHLSIRATTGDPQQSEALVNLAAQALTQLNHAVLQKKISEAQLFLQQELEELRTNLNSVEEAEWQFLREKGFNTYEEVMSELREKNAELVETHTTRSELLGTLAKIEAELKKNNVTLPQSLSQINDSLIVKLLEELEELQKEELQMGMVYEGAYPPIQQLREDIAEKKQTVLEAVRRYEDNASPGSNLWTDMQNLRRRHTELQLDLSQLDSRATSTENRIEHLLGRLPEFSQNSQEYNQITREVQGFQRQYNRVLEREFETRSAIRARVGELESYTPVEIRPIVPPGSRLYIPFIIGGVVGLFLSAGLAILLDLMDTSIRSEDDVTRYLDQPVVGAIPMMKDLDTPPKRKRRNDQQPLVPPGSVSNCLVTLTDPKSPIAEAYRSLRTNFQFATVAQPARTVMITSAVPGEGKTTTSINLAVAMAVSGLRVLLVDADLRRPNVHRMLKLKRSPGLSEVLADGFDVHHAMQGCHIDNLLVIPSGHLPHNPSELIGSGAMRDLLDRMGDEFDLVICDAPSIIVVTDPMIMSKLVDTILMVVSVDNARRETVGRAIDLLKDASGPLAGVVLNGLKATRRRYYYYYYYDDSSNAKKKRKWFHG